MKKLESLQLKKISGGVKNPISEGWYYLSKYGTRAVLSHGNAVRKYGVGYLTHT